VSFSARSNSSCHGSFIYSRLLSFFIDSTMRSYILECTNKRLPCDCETITDEEFLGFIGILYMLGVTKRRFVSVNEIWNPNSLHYSGVVSLAMSRTRFQTISRHLCFYNKDKRPVVTDKLYKCRFVFDYFQAKLKAAFEPHENLTVDEQLYAFRGNCQFRQYMPNKPAKYGIKYWCLADVRTSYLCNVNVYLGRDSTRTASVSETAVTSLVAPFYGSKRNVTTDSFFTSIPLAQRLWQEKMTLTGTLRKNKAEIPPQLKNVGAREVGSSTFRFHDELTIVSYIPKRRKNVVLLSTQHHRPHVSSDGKPEMVHFYNETKGAVDTLDHLVANFSCGRKTNRWPLNVFFFLLDIAAFNAFVLSSQRQPVFSNINRQRRRSLETLAACLVDQCTVSRTSDWEATNGNGISNSQYESAVERGYVGKKRRSSHSISSSSGLGNCFLCNVRKRSRNSCVKCDRHVCKEHSSFICRKCR